MSAKETYIGYKTMTNRGKPPRKQLNTRVSRVKSPPPKLNTVSDVYQLENLSGNDDSNDDGSNDSSADGSNNGSTDGYSPGPTKVAYNEGLHNVKPPRKQLQTLANRDGTSSGDDSSVAEEDMTKAALIYHIDCKENEEDMTKAALICHVDCKVKTLLSLRNLTRQELIQISNLCDTSRIVKKGIDE